MKPRGPLMREHRLIERMISLMDCEVGRMRSEGDADPRFIDRAVDFFRTYADRTHHGKEEDILFKVLAAKDMDGHHQHLMAELVEDHRFGRRVTAELVDARNQYAAGDKAAVGLIVDRMRALKEFYPRHIAKEDRDFFLGSEKYLSPAEQAEMLEQFAAFDRAMIHEKYEKDVVALEEARLLKPAGL